MLVTSKLGWVPTRIRVTPGQKYLVWSTPPMSWSTHPSVIKIRDFAISLNVCLVCTHSVKRWNTIQNLLFCKPVFAYREKYFLHWQTNSPHCLSKTYTSLHLLIQFLIRISKIFVSYIDVLTLIHISAQDTYQSFGSCSKYL